jgi:TolB-like protein
VIVVWSRRSIGKAGHFVRDEARRAQKRGVYLPVRLDGVDPPLGFGEIQALPLKGWKGDPADPRFRAVAEAVRNRIEGKDLPESADTFDAPRISRRALVAGAAGVAVLAVGGGSWLLLRPQASRNPRRIAVMPFDNLSGDPNQGYFAEGLAEELREALRRIGLQVIGRASSDAVDNLDTRTAARKLHVANILTGSVRRSPELIRISAQLISGSDGVEQWSQSYDRAPGDTIKIQTDIAANVALALSVALGQAARAALTLGGTADAAAQDLFLRATELKYKVGDEDSLHQSLRLLDKAIARDGNYADAYALKATELEILGSNYAASTADMIDKLAQAEVAAKRAIALAPSLGSSYVPLALIEADRLNFAGALQNMRQALTLSPRNLSVLSNASLFLQWFGDGEKALELASRLIALDPLRGNNYVRRGAVQLFALRQYPQALASFGSALALAPKLSTVHNFVGDCLVLMNRLAEAKAEFAKVPADDPARMAGEAIVAIRSGNSSAAEQIVARMRARFRDAASFQYAEVYAQAGKPDAAFAELDNAVRVKDPGLAQLKSEPFLDPIMRDPRYGALLKRLNFPVWS